MNVVVEPRFAYHLSGPARYEWEHSIPQMGVLRYSSTYHNLRKDWTVLGSGIKNMKEFMYGVALVTRANRGIGLEVALQLTMRGFTTAPGMRNPQKGKEASSSLQQSGLGGHPHSVRRDRTKRIDAMK